MLRVYPITRKIDPMGKITIEIRPLFDARAKQAKKDNEKFTVERVAYETNLALNTVRSWLKGGVTRIDAETLATFCDYFNCNPSDIIKYTPDAE